jgi:hypothetical protein
MNHRATIVGAFALALMPLAGSGQDEDKFTKEFPISECDFKTAGTNPYFILEPGRQLHFNNFRCVSEGQCDEVEEVIITVLTETRDVTFKIDSKPKSVTTHIVEERETADGQVTEISRNFYAECDDTEDIYYFGEEVCVPPDSDGMAQGPVSFTCPSGLVPAEDAWMAGVNGARPGIIFPGGAFLLGARYFQEIAPGVALDRAEHVNLGLEVETPAGEFEDCVEVKETTPLDPAALSQKIYCPGIGLVVDDELELTSVIHQ